MNLIKPLVVSVLLVGVTACEETPTGDGVRTVKAPLAPEYLDCKSVPREIAIADGYTEQFGVYDTKGAYWAKRSERLSARAAECKKRR